jgi:sulfotransferase family protein
VTMPNFFVVGAPKAGTTSLCRYLGQHPDVFVSPIKEPCFFAPEVAQFNDQTREREAEGAFVLDWERYLQLFAGVTREAAVGEGSVSYLGSADAPASIRARIPNARIIMMLRDPIDRLFSHYVGARAAGVASTGFVAWAHEQLDVEAMRRPVWGSVWAGRYGLHLQRYLAVFPVQQVRVHLYDDYARSPEEVYRDLLTFLDVDPAYPLDARRRDNVTLVPRWPLLRHRLAAPVKRTIRALVPERLVERARQWALAPRPPGPARDERAELIEIYRDDVRVLQTLIDRDLSVWLDPRQSAVA